MTFSAVALFGQTTNFLGVGASYTGDYYASTVAYGRLLSQTSGTYNFWAVDYIPTSLKPITVTSNLSTGIMQKVLSTGPVTFYVPATAGLSSSGPNTGWFWSAGGLATINIGKSGWTLDPTVRIGKTNVTIVGAQQYQVIVGVIFGFGW